MPGSEPPVHRGIAATARALTSLEAGERAWFWMCFDVLPGAPALLIEPLRTDPDKARLSKRRAAVRRLPGAPEAAGVAMVGEDGRLSFVGPALSPALLSTLATWTRRHHVAHPGLARLRGAAFHRTGPDGVVLQTCQDGDWTGVPEVSAPGTLAEAAEILAALAPGQQAWLWLTPRGPDGTPMLSMMRAEQGSPEAFQARIQRILARGARGGDAISGLLRRGEDGVLLTTRSPAKRWQRTVAALLSRSDLPATPLGTLRLVRITDQGPVGPEVMEPWMELSTQSALLRAMTPEAGVVPFWFTSSARNGKPLLLMDSDTARLRGRATAAGGTGHSSRGRIRCAEDGSIELMIRHPHPDLIPRLARWVGARRSRWPALNRLHGARLVLVQKDGSRQVIEQPDAWPEPVTQRSAAQ